MILPCVARTAVTSFTPSNVGMGFRPGSDAVATDWCSSDLSGMASPEGKCRLTLSRSSTAARVIGKQRGIDHRAGVIKSPPDTPSCEHGRWMQHV